MNFFYRLKFRYQHQSFALLIASLIIYRLSAIVVKRPLRIKVLSGLMKLNNLFTSRYITTPAILLVWALQFDMPFRAFTFTIRGLITFIINTKKSIPSHQQREFKSSVQLVYETVRLILTTIDMCYWRFSNNFNVYFLMHRSVPLTHVKSSTFASVKWLLFIVKDKILHASDCLNRSDRLAPPIAQC